MKATPRPLVSNVFEVQVDQLSLKESVVVICLLELCSLRRLGGKTY